VRHWLGYASDAYLNFLLSQLHPEKDELILDNGCGNGRFSIALRQKGARVVALDVNLSLLKKGAVKAKEEMLDSKIEFILADMQSLPFKVGIFEKILCVHNLWYVPRYKTAVREMFRTLKKNGEMVVDHLNFLNLHVLLAWVQYVASRIGRRSPTPVFYRNPYEILRPFAFSRTSVFSLFTRQSRLYAMKGINPFASRLVVKCLK
jgi:ubiquinone/menaquinone biosynthesis C-methylase UbiE